MIKIHCSHDAMVPIKDLKPHPSNRNKHPKEQIERLVKILEFQGIRSPIKVSKRSGFITAGHGRLEAFKKLKMKQVPVNYQDYDSDSQEYADIQSDNAIALWAELDLSGINNDVPNFGTEFDVDLLGIKNFTLTSAEEFEPGCDEDEVPEHVEPNAKLGDIYKLGNHRLMCGDSTSIDAVERLMDGEKADITFTSPPYNVGKTPNGNAQKYLSDSDNKNSGDFKNLLNDFTNNCLMFSDYVFSNIQSLAGNKIALIEHLYDLRHRFADVIIWDKKNAEPAMARRVLNSRFEYIHIFSNEAKRTIGKRDFRGTLDNIFELNSRQGKEFSKIHKATFPVQFPQHFIENFTEASCLDPFGGTGSTLIACEKTNRKCFMMELDPHYVDVIVARWEKYTGKKVELINGKT